MLKEKISLLVDSKKEIFCDLSDRIWDHPEIGLEEFYSSEAIIKVLKDEGFTVETGLAGIGTAFKGTWGTGHPAIGFLGEYDALAGMSQKSMSTFQEPVEEGCPGHGCGHNLLGAGALAAAVALKDHLEAEVLPGTVIYFGCPAEETASCKTPMARDGVFNAADIAITWHSADKSRVVTETCLTDCMMVFRFKGKSAHAAAAPHLGRSALDAAELFNVGIQYLREHIPDGCRIQYAYLDVGGQAPNVVQNSAALYYDYRALDNKMSAELRPRIIRVAEGAAHMTETEMECEVTSAMSNYVPNMALSETMGEAMEELGPIGFSKEAYDLADRMTETIPETDIKESAASFREFLESDEAERRAALHLQDEPLPYKAFVKREMASTDVGDVSYVVPTAQCKVTTETFGSQLHSWQVVSQGKSPIAHEGMIYAAKVMALTAAKVIADPELFEAVISEHRKNIPAYDCPLPEGIIPKVVR